MSSPRTHAVECSIFLQPMAPGAESELHDTLADEYAGCGLRVSHRLRALEGFGRSGPVYRDTSAVLGPPTVISIDDAGIIARTAPSLLALAQVELITIKPIRLCKARGRRYQPPAPTADQPAWSRITLYSDGETLLGWHPEHLELVQRLRELGAPGERYGAAPSDTRHRRLRTRNPRVHLRSPPHATPEAIAPFVVAAAGHEEIDGASLRTPRSANRRPRPAVAGCELTLAE
jgi:hypothetical protein